MDNKICTLPLDIEVTKYAKIGYCDVHPVTLQKHGEVQHFIAQKSSILRPTRKGVQ